jgi:type II secretory pathway component PulF
MNAPETACGFRYRAVRPDGTIEQGVLDSSTREGVLATLAARGVVPVEIRRRPAERLNGRGLSITDLAVGLRMLASLLESGLSIGRALTMMVDLAPSGWQRGLATIRAAIQEGRAFAAALEASPFKTPPALVGIIRAGEAAGKLTASVRSAAEWAEGQASARAALYSALAYPLVLALATTASVGLLVGVVIPRFAKVLADVGGTLPPSTTAVLAIAHLVRSAAIPGTIACLALYVAWKTWISSNAGLTRWHGWLLKLPAIGPVRQSRNTSRFCAALGALLGNGAPLSAALTHASNSSTDAALRTSADKARTAVVEGQPLSGALETHRVTTLTAIRLIRAGEESGRVTTMLEHAARFEAERADYAMKNALRFVEPALILLLGGTVATVAAALLQALYNMRPGP